MPRLLGTALKAVALVAYAAVLAEVFIRLVHPQPHMPRYVTGTAWGVRGNIPGAIYRHTTAEVNVGFSINAQGMRADRDFPEARPAGVCRIALLGDSFMMGYELDLPDTFAARLEKALNARGKHVEVLNFAVSGFGTAESLRTYEGYVRRFDPNLVVMEWDRSDYDDNVRADLYRLTDGHLVPTGQTFLPSVGLQERLMRNPLYRWVSDNSDLYNFLREYLGLQVRNLSAGLINTAIGLRARFSHDAAPASSTPPSVAPWANGISPYAVTLSAHLLEDAGRIIAEDGRGYMVLEIPYQYPARHSVSSLDLMDEAVRGRLPVVSAVEAFNREAAAGQKLFYESGDGHITPYAVGLLLAPALDRLMKDPHLDGC